MPCHAGARPPLRAVCRNCCCVTGLAKPACPLAHGTFPNWRKGKTRRPRRLLCPAGASSPIQQRCAAIRRHAPPTFSHPNCPSTNRNRFSVLQTSHGRGEPIDPTPRTGAFSLSARRRFFSPRPKSSSANVFIACFVSRMLSAAATAALASFNSLLAAAAAAFNDATVVVCAFGLR